MKRRLIAHPFFAAILFAGIGLFVLLGLCACQPTPTPQTEKVLPATWTPTPLAPVPTPISASFAVTQVAPTPTPVRPSTPPTPTSGHPPTATVTPGPPPSTPAEVSLAATPAVQAANGRIDAMGPLPLSTAQPLPPGRGAPPVRLIIPALDIDTPVKPMGWRVVEDDSGSHSEWEVVDDAAGHHINSAYPGEAGNVVISGHHNIGGSVFKSLSVIGEPGIAFGLGDAVILVDQQGRRFTYAVNGWWRVEERNASIARQEANASYMQPTSEPRLTMITCWPPWSNTHRVIVTALLTSIESR